ncbi:MAG: M42 family metallopeptidase [Bacillota bacterium]
MKEHLWSKLERLTGLQGVSGHETPVIEFLQSELRPLVDSVEVDPLGNVLMTRAGSREGPRLLIAAHSDQIGAVVRYADDDGFLRLERIGGILNSLLVGRKVRVGDVFGVIGVKAGHYQTPEDRRRVPETQDLYVDIGVDSREAAEDLGVTVGTPVTYDDQLSLFADGHRFAGAGVDNRAGCAVLWQVLQELKDDDFGGQLCAAFTVQEETGLRGAGAAAERIRPDFALALDTIPCGGTPDVGRDLLHTEIGRGPVFALVSGPGGRAPVPPKIRRILLSTAEKHGIPHQPVIFSGGNNDAAAMQLAGGGIAAGSITIPRRYSHSPVEMADLRDLEHTTQLLTAVVREMEEYGRDFSFV